MAQMEGVIKLGLQHCADASPFRGVDEGLFAKQLCEVGTDVVRGTNEDEQKKQADGVQQGGSGRLHT